MALIYSHTVLRMTALPESPGDCYIPQKQGLSPHGTCDQGNSAQRPARGSDPVSDHGVDTAGIQTMVLPALLSLEVKHLTPTIKEAQRGWPMDTRKDTRSPLPT